MKVGCCVHGARDMRNSRIVQINRTV